MAHVKETQKRSHLFEVDLIRAITVVSVVTLHSLSMTKFLLPDQFSLYVFGVVGHALNYSREMFMFVTAFVLTYVYYHRSFSYVGFWKKRMLVVLIPYIAWSMFYVMFYHPTSDMVSYLTMSLLAILTGEAAFQLYYILLTVQFYLIFPDCPAEIGRKEE